MAKKIILNSSVNDISENMIQERKYDIKYLINNAIKMLNNYDDKYGKKIDVDFLKDKWVFLYEIDYSIQTFDFQEIRECLKFNNDIDIEDFILKTKLWVVNIITRKAIITSHTDFRYFISAVKHTNGFKNENLNKFYDDLNANLIIRFNCLNYVSDDSLFKCITSIKSFLKLYEEEYGHILMKIIELFPDKVRSSSRLLPKFSVFVEFNMYLINWYNEIIENFDESKHNKFYILYLWFNLGCIIPMRPSEFCLIKYDCIGFENGKYYIKFPRLKHQRKGAFRKNIYEEKFAISSTLYDAIQFYKSNVVPETREYLIQISEEFSISVQNKIDIEKNEIHIINDTINEIIKEFTLEIKKNKTENIHNTNESRRNYIYSGDLRHIAIINMMMQGYNRVEIEYLAGHYNTETQYSYINHAETWMNIEVLKLEKSIRDLSDNECVSHMNTFETQEMIEKLMENTFIGKGSSEKYIKLDIGYCKNKDMPCPTYNWKHKGDYFCEYWGISPEELLEKRIIIENDLNDLYNETVDKLIFLKSLYAIRKKDKNQEYQETITSTRNEINSNLKCIAKLRKGVWSEWSQKEEGKEF
ncbi:phage integrase family protein [Clostridium puniceum]|uniref:Phage integrase family protein n=1 Tax=Clostridium puniceum TaxID=29367 RepID=A0A1S8TFS4_9CLOT|nr:tyrosine-type recombinase/integrase [Clostridium puniceum]OOM76469.1 phage integrase family protein [Clostridium puniceum]